MSPKEKLEEGLRPTLWDREELSQFKVALVGEKERERIQIITQKNECHCRSP